MGICHSYLLVINAPGLTGVCYDGTMKRALVYLVLLRKHFTPLLIPCI
jgi:hypothetical protein